MSTVASRTARAGTSRLAPALAADHARLGLIAVLLGLAVNALTRAADAAADGGRGHAAARAATDRLGRHRVAVDASGTR